MNKYEKFARQTAQAICELMNLFYKREQSRMFKRELIDSLVSIEYKNGKWILTEEVKK